VGLSAYLAIATSRGVALFVDLGIRQDVMGSVEYTLGRGIAFAFIVLLFFALYKYLPDRRVRWRTALLAAIVASVLFEVAKNLYTVWVGSFSATSIYTGTLFAVVSVVFWVYYAAVIFILGGEVAQVHELRRMQRLQRETFEG
jgi:membrane protein